MTFVWDEAKNRINQRKHGISFDVAARAFADPNAVSYPERMVESEERWHTIGLAGGMLLLLVAHTVEEKDEEEIRIVSARKATPRERDFYHSAQ